MRIVIGTLVLNEMEWLPRLYEQHKNWPGLIEWIFVEAADTEYARANPRLVSSFGLSTDGTTEFLQGLALSDSRIRHIPYGFTTANSSSQGKCAARSEYLRLADPIEPDCLVVLDADEFYRNDHQSTISSKVAKHIRTATGIVVHQRQLWRPPSIADRPLGELEVVGGFWDIPHTRFWRWIPRLRYSRNHNTPETPGGIMMDVKLMRMDRMSPQLYGVHTGYASSLRMRAAKNRYYELRGESRDPKRRWYTESRSAFEIWTEGDELPYGASVIPYRGLMPECLLTFGEKDERIAAGIG